MSREQRQGLPAFKGNACAVTICMGYKVQNSYISHGTSHQKIICGIAITSSLQASDFYIAKTSVSYQHNYFP
jgi:hypothetical protein